MVKKSRMFSDGSKRRLFNIRSIGSVEFYSLTAHASFVEAKKRRSLEIKNIKQFMKLKDEKTSRNTFSATFPSGFPYVSKIVKEGTLYRVYSNNTVGNMSHFDRFKKNKETTILPIKEQIE
jgi:hypothetical protein